MIRYFRLYLYFIRFSFSKAMEFRVDFSFRIFMDMFFYTTQFLLFNIIYLHTPALGGWTQEQVTLFIGSFIFVDAFNMTFFATNAWWFPIYVNRGELDYYLTKPVSAFYFMGFKEIAANSFINLVLASSILSYILITTPLVLDPFKLFIYFICLINGAMLYYIIQLLFLMTTFWSGSPRGFGDLFFSAEKVMHRPDGIFTGYIRRLFLHILPFSMMASYPVRYLISPESNGLILEIVLSSLFIYFVFFVAWKRGLRDYSSASS